MFALILKWADKHIHKSENDSETSLIALWQVLRNSFSLVYNTEFDVFAKNFIRVAVVGNKYLIRSHFNLWTYWGGGGGGGVGSYPSSEFFICCSISKRFCLKWKASDLLSKMRYILWIVAVLEACDVTNNGRHLGFYQELEIKFKKIARNGNFLCLT